MSGGLQELSVVVVNRLTFSVPVDSVVPSVQDRFPAAFDGCPGFERFELVKVSDTAAIVLIHWADAQAAADGAARIGPTVFREVIGPLLAAEQVREAGPVVVSHPA